VFLVPYYYTVNIYALVPEQNLKIYYLLDIYSPPHPIARGAEKQVKVEVKVKKKRWAANLRRESSKGSSKLKVQKRYADYGSLYLRYCEEREAKKCPIFVQPAANCCSGLKLNP